MIYVDTNITKTVLICVLAKIKIDRPFMGTR